MTIKELRKKAGMTQKQFGEYFKIPHRTIQNWEGGQRSCPDYLLNLMIYKLKSEMIDLIVTERKDNMFTFKEEIINNVKYAMGCQAQGGELNGVTYDHSKSQKLVEALRIVECFKLDTLCDEIRRGDIEFPITVTEPDSLFPWEKTRIETDKWVIRSSLFTYEFNKYASNVEALLNEKSKFAIEFKS